MGSPRCFRRIGPIISQARQSVGCGEEFWRFEDGLGQAVWTRKGGRRNCTHMRGLYAGAVKCVLQTQGRAKEGQTGETLAARPAWVL